MKSRIIALVVAVGILAGLILVADPSKVAGVLSRTNLYWVLFGLAIWPLQVYLRTERWRFLLAKVGMHIPFFQAAKIFVAGLAISNLTPAKSGDPVRSLLLKKVSGDKVGVTLPAILVERVSDIVSMIIISVLIFFAVLGAPTGGILTWFGAAVAVYSISFLLAIYIFFSRERVKKATTFLFRAFSWWPKMKNLEPKMDAFAEDLYKSFVVYSKPKTVIRVISFSIVIWVFEGVTFWAALQALGLGGSGMVVLASIASVSMATLIAVLTFLPGGLGAGELVSITFLTALFPFSFADVVAGSLLARFMSFWVYIFVGWTLLFSMRYRYSI